MGAEKGKEMILADKIVDLRKKAGLSQEELANKLGVSRQSVSKWEGAQSTPDMDKVLKLADLFGVSTDYLLRDEIGAPADAPAQVPDVPTGTDDEPLDPVSLEEANAFLAENEKHATRVATGVGLCVLSSVPLLALAGADEAGFLDMTEEMAASVGVAILLALVAAGVSLFVIGGSRMKRYEHLQKNPLDTAYGVDGMVRERRERGEHARTVQVAVGVVLCIIAAIPVLLSAAVSSTGNSLPIGGVAILMALVAAGVFLLVRAGILDGGYQALLEEGDYTREAKRLSKRYGSIYWGIALAIYLLVSLVTMQWQSTWIVWPVAGVGYGIFASIMRGRK